MIEIDDLRFEYGDGDFSLGVPGLSVADRERVAITGPSGSGKTTLLNLMAGIFRPDQGRIAVAGAELQSMDDRALRRHRVTRLGLVFQEFELLEYLDVQDNILLPFRINGALKLTQQSKARAREIASKVGMADKLNRLPGQLSQGERQRVAICRALITEPELMLADEPTGNLDPANKHRVLDILFDYAHEHDATLIAVTHDRELIPRFSRVVDFKSFQDPSEMILQETL